MSLQVSRNRILNVPNPGTFVQTVSGGSTTTQVRSATSVHSCQDVTGKYATGGRLVDHPVVIDHIRRSDAVPLNGHFKNSFVERRYTNCLSTYANGTTPAHLSVPGIPSNGADALKVLAYTNPSRNGQGSWGETLGDIGQLPKLLNKAGGSLIKRLANGKLLYDWALMPVLEDIQRLFDLQRDIERRLRELESLQRKGGLRRKIELGRYSASSAPDPTAFESAGASVNGIVTRTTEVHRWGSVRWSFPAGYRLPPVPPKVLRGWALRHVLGLNPDFELIWELIPWTFLFDWWRDVGNWLSAQYRDLPADPSPVCIMTHTKTTYAMRVTSASSWISGGGGMLVRETKRRDVVVGLPAVLSSQGPALGPGQLTNLGALLVKYL